MLILRQEFPEKLRSLEENLTKGLNSKRIWLVRCSCNTKEE